MEYISLNLSDISELVVPIIISVIEACCYGEGVNSEHLSLFLAFSGIRVARSFIFFVMFCT